MGSSSSKPEFVTVLNDIYTAECGEKVTLQCEIKGKDVTAKWDKDDNKFICVEGKHKVSQCGTTCVLDILEARDSDEGKYTLTLSNKSGSESFSALVKIVIPQWREVQWEGYDEMFNDLKTFKVCKPVEHLNFLLYGLVGTGQSSIINTIRSIFEGRLFINCLAAAGSTTSHTVSFGSYRFANEKRSFPFTFYDVMGAEAKGKDGVNTQDIISALEGHLKEGFKFNSKAPLSENEDYYNRNPVLSEQMHCLVNVIAADKISMMEIEFNNEWKKTIRETASIIGIPQVVFMTHVDRLCPLTKKNLQNVYKSKKIREKMIECSNNTGIPMNCIFPVMNYHEQTDVKTDINCLMLHALKNIVPWANDYVKNRSNNQNPHQQPNE